VISTREQDARDAALWRAARDLARLHGSVWLLDRLDTALVAVGGERQTSEATTLDGALALAARRLGIDAEPPTLTRDTIPTVPQYDSDEGGP
jgi:hypothetical protein